MSFDIHILTIPGRESLVQELVDSLGCDDVIVHNDKFKQGVWYNARRAWLSPNITHVTHRLLLHDDIETCDNFLQHVRDVIRAVPHSPINLFCSRGEPVGRSFGSFVKYKGFGWGAATILPFFEINDFISWCDFYIKPEFRPDDTRLVMWSMARLRRIYATVPSLVQHRSDAISTVGNEQFQASVYAQDPGVLEWSENDSVECVRDAEAYFTSRKKWLTQFYFKMLR